MYKTKRFELPNSLRGQFNKAVKIEVITLIYLISVVFVMYFVLGSSQAMKAAWFEDILSIVPAIAFLVSSRIYAKKPNDEYPYGFHRVYSISFLAGSLALFGIGGFLLVDSSIALFSKEHPTIGNINIFGQAIWMGWLMILALLYSAIPSFILGKVKKPFAVKLHNKVLFTDAQAQRADYMTAGAAIVGIIGIGFGIWWADAAAALFISVDILHDGLKRSKEAITDLIDRMPKDVEGKGEDPLINSLEKKLSKIRWITEYQLRVRENGQVYFVEVVVIPKNEKNLLENIKRTQNDLANLHWKIQDVTITPTGEKSEA